MQIPRGWETSQDNRQSGRDSNTLPPKSSLRVLSLQQSAQSQSEPDFTRRESAYMYIHGVLTRLRSDNVCYSPRTRKDRL
jgi:hypothetical protein